MSDKFLIIRFSSLGDVLLTTPFLRALKKSRPDSEIHYLTKSKYEELLRGNPSISRLILFDDQHGLFSLKRLSRRLKNEQYSCVIDLHGSLRSRYLTWELMPKKLLQMHKQTFKKQLLIWARINLLSKKSVPPPLMAERFFQVGETLGIKPDGIEPEITISDGARKKIEREFPQKNYIGLCPVATWPNKRWDSEKFSETGRILSEDKKSSVVIFGGKKDEEICEVTAQSVGKNAKSVAGKLNLQETTALIARCTILVTNDTGAMHIATAVRTPVVAVFGPTTHHWGYFPHAPQEKYRVIEKELSCRPCTTNGEATCPLGHHNCMKLIPVSEVVEASRKLVS